MSDTTNEVHISADVKTTYSITYKGMHYIVEKEDEYVTIELDEQRDGWDARIPWKVLKAIYERIEKAP